MFQQGYFFLRKDNAGVKETREVKGSTDMVLNAEIEGGKMKKLILLLILSITSSCVYKPPIYLYDERYAHLREGSVDEPAPWPD